MENNILKSPEASMNIIIKIPPSQGFLIIGVMCHELRGVLTISCLEVICFLSYLIALAVSV